MKQKKIKLKMKIMKTYFYKKFKIKIFKKFGYYCCLKIKFILLNNDKNKHKHKLNKHKKNLSLSTINNK